MESFSKSELAAEPCGILWTTYFKSMLSASSVRPGGSSTSTSSMPRLAAKLTPGMPGVPRESTVLMRPMVSPNGWNDGPTLSVRRGEHSRGDVAGSSSSATTSVAPPSSFRSPTATEDSVLGGEPWGCQ